MKAANQETLMLKRAVWAYFLLLIFEGALRKWFLPGLATPLLIIRDPIALWVVYKLWNRGELPKSIYLTGMVVIGLLGIITALLFGHGSLPVAIFGARILMIHFPFMFAMGKIFDREDVIDLGKVFLWITIPMAILIAAQFYSPQSAWVNRGVGGDLEGAGFSGAMGYFRPPGTFSFTNGNSFFFNMATVFVVYFWLNPKNVNKIILIGASIGVLMSIPLSISRSLFFSMIITVFFAGVGSSLNKKYAPKIMFAGIIVFIGLLVLSQMEFFKTATAAFTDRFESANTNEGGLESVIADRYLGGMIGALKTSAEQDFFGYGIGMGTNVGSKLLTGGTVFLISEGEWGRVIGEQGAIMGLGIIFLRLGLSFKLLTHGFRRMLSGDLLPWLLLSFALLIIPQGQWAQPTSLGFSTLVGGLLIASLRGVEPEIDQPVFKREEDLINIDYKMEGAG